MAMNTSFLGERAGRSLALLPATLCLALALAMPAAPVLAQGAGPAQPDAITPVEEFSRQLDEFKKSIPDLNKKIEDSAASVDRWTDVDKARKEIEELRALVSAALGAVSDNGAVSQLGAKALNHAREKMRTLEQETRFKPEEKQFLMDQWRKLRDETERATDELGTARKEFSELLRTLQGNEDFIDELIQIRQASKALEVIRRLTKDIREASDQLKKLIGGIKPPGV
jgi:DNA repair exonuclease SbcCD ATPase subunit